ncbi:hypothetical protein BURK2_00200 [Burkholderiales bacterium]|nr:hypothetical protein BURK2_00200 [Burkholderiales bacterium]
MSDFLTRLAQRSIGAAPLIAPRLPSLFAPDEPAPAAINTEVQPVADVAHITAAASLPMKPHVAGSIRADTAEQHVVVSPQRHSTPETKKTAPAAAPIEHTLPRVEQAPAPLVEASRANPQLAQAPAPAARAAVLAASDGAEPLPARPATEPSGHAPVAPQAWQPLLPQRAAQPATTFAVAPDTSTTQRAATAPAAPTVNITIGRVEVRANVAAPQPAARPRTASKPALSLGDYLKHGAGAS